MAALADPTQQAEHPAGLADPFAASIDEASSPDTLSVILFNRAGALVLLILLAPLMLVVTWAIWRRDGAPILYRQWRVGAGGRLFACLKFRSMRCDAHLVLQRVLESDPRAREEWQRNHKLRDDPRITPVGRFLRRTSLDELPQLFNVLRGEMNLVGPRPIVVQELRKYGAAKREYLSVPPGMTGLWQVSGRSDTSYEERVALDRAYVARRSLLLDLWILLRTAGVIVSRDGAC